MNDWYCKYSWKFAKVILLCHFLLEYFRHTVRFLKNLYIVLLLLPIVMLDLTIMFVYSKNSINVKTVYYYPWQRSREENLKELFHLHRQAWCVIVLILVHLASLRSQKIKIIIYTAKLFILFRSHFFIVNDDFTITTYPLTKFIYLINCIPYALSILSDNIMVLIRYLVNNLFLLNKVRNLKKI